jgi:hypothetical protein
MSVQTLRDQIKDKEDFAVSEPIPCPEWDTEDSPCVLHVRTISGAERDSFEESVLVKKGKKREVSLKDIRAKLVVLSACDSNGTPVFLPGDERWLTDKSGRALDRLFSAAQKLNGITEEDVEELMGN